MSRELRPALAAVIIFTVLTGLLYPLAITVVARVVFPYQSAGSLIVRGGRAVGSALIGQPFDDPKYFWSRPSATAPYPYNAGASSGSNLGPTARALREAAARRIAALRRADPAAGGPIPVDLVTASGSGLDPHISPAAAEYQVRRVARARGVDESAVRRLVQRFTQGRQLGILGEPRVNVLELNMALDAMSR
jgi:K+-transporting ATPase ATPase C chain